VTVARGPWPAPCAGPAPRPGSCSWKDS
jgi:hypothetical protein